MKFHSISREEKRIMLKQGVPTKWIELLEQGKVPVNIPKRPDIYYSGKLTGEYISFKEAKEYVQKNLMFTFP